MSTCRPLLAGAVCFAFGALLSLSLAATTPSLPVSESTRPGVSGNITALRAPAEHLGVSGEDTTEPRAPAASDAPLTAAEWPLRAPSLPGYADLPADVAALLDDDEPMRVGHEAASARGVWPLSFALPAAKWRAVPTLVSNASAWLPWPPCATDADCLARAAGPPTFHKTKHWATVFPGDKSTYVFKDEDSYMDDYATSWFAHTFRKSGYDCMRHLEIIGAGAVPVFRNAARIPRYVMTDYPKRLLAHIEAKHAAADVSTRAAWREALLRWGAAHLTTTARIRYMAAAAGVALHAGSRVAFVDTNLPRKADYSSVMCLIGLVETFGAGVDVLYEPEYLYGGGRRQYIDGKPLYGGGFNYARALPPLLRTPRRPLAEALAYLAAGAYDVVVYGSWTRSKAHADLVLGRYPRQRVWLIDAGDTPAGWHRDPAVRANATVFVRELTNLD
jgi:hypothetical protein